VKGERKSKGVRIRLEASLLEYLFVALDMITWEEIGPAVKAQATFSAFTHFDDVLFDVL
jgi:hypothetical protein